MQASSPRPPFEVLSVLIASTLLNYSLAQFISLPEIFLPFQALGVFLPFRLTAGTVIAATSAALVATGTDWLIRRHPSRPSGSTIPNLVLPSLTAWILAFPINNLNPGPTWWLALAGAALVLLVVLSAEYASFDAISTRSSFAAAVLSSIAYAVFLILAVTLQSLNARLLILLPTIALAAGLVHLRLNHIQFAQWRWLESGAAALLAIAIAAPLHYLPISPVSFGVLILAILYAFTSLSASLQIGKTTRQAIAEPALSIIAGILIAILL